LRNEYRHQFTSISLNMPAFSFYMHKQMIEKKKLKALYCKQKKPPEGGFKITNCAEFP